MTFLKQSKESTHKITSTSPVDPIQVLNHGKSPTTSFLAVAILLWILQPLTISHFKRIEEVHTQIKCTPVTQVVSSRRLTILYSTQDCSIHKQYYSSSVLKKIYTDAVSEVNLDVPYQYR